MVDLFQNLLKYQSENNKPLSEEIVQYIMKQIIEGLKYLFNKNIMHRQIALDNILINYDDENDREKKNIMKGTIKIFGFGAARYLKKGELAGSIVGNPMNMSPILLKGLSSEHFKKMLCIMKKKMFGV